MYKEIKIKGLKPTDRVFQFKEKLVKVRLVNKKIVTQNKLYGPNAISFQISACICDKTGKAIPDGEGSFAILPHTLTLPLMELGKDEAEIKKGLENAFHPLIEKTVIWYQTRKAAEKVFKAWENT